MAKKPTEERKVTRQEFDSLVDRILAYRPKVQNGKSRSQIIKESRSRKRQNHEEQA
uniref:Uncharacterized protein n=1 Tax=Candidatus Kentrum sp. DK TaxID=2126562 RepID=A0A450SNB5_9GAMM|nr:MAG: hypothetical protein BECKDK2373C_GA0170839_10487 [Candidatus Kentron sp. DK]VFJ55441.1 MAG: hypothetical protein BECKDK2373B_GA0170837_105218 [Candidatus Kentron sp. DK]